MAAHKKNLQEHFKTRLSSLLFQVQPCWGCFFPFFKVYANVIICSEHMAQFMQHKKSKALKIVWLLCPWKKRFNKNHCMSLHSHHCGPLAVSALSSYNIIIIIPFNRHTKVAVVVCCRSQQGGTVCAGTLNPDCQGDPINLPREHQSLTPLPHHKDCKFFF